MLSFNLAKNRVAVWPVHLNRPCSFKEPESTVTLVSGEAMFLNQATTNQSSTGQTKDIGKKALNFPPWNVIQFRGWMWSMTSCCKPLLFFSSQHFFSAAAPFHLTACLVPQPGDRVWRWVRFGPEDPTTENPERWSYIRVPRVQLCGRDNGLYQAQRAPRSVRRRTLLLK